MSEQHNPDGYFLTTNSENALWQTLKGNIDNQLWV